ncbi:MAG: ATP-binding protein, partial [Phenylobacterium sp.]
PQALRQILVNLVGNAVKFTAAGAVALRLCRADGRLIVEVADTGPGLSDDQKARLFQRFSQVDGSSTRQHGGTGLGLAICHGLATAMGGEIGVSSTPGEGSVFVLEVPAPDVAQAPAAPGASAGPMLLNDLRLLVVDDHPANRELARLVLESAGAEVRLEADGAGGLKAAAALPYDLILMDLQMPGMNGAAAVARLRAQPGPNQNVPVLAFTAADPTTVLPPGFDGMVSKPLDRTRLLAAVGAAVAEQFQLPGGGSHVSVS